MGVLTIITCPVHSRNTCIVRCGVQIHVVSIIKGDCIIPKIHIYLGKPRFMIQIELIIFDTMMYALTEIDVTIILVIDTTLNCLGV